MTNQKYYLHLNMDEQSVIVLFKKYRDEGEKIVATIITSPYTKKEGYPFYKFDIIIVTEKSSHVK